jgi:hypothetical protein
VNNSDEIPIPKAGLSLGADIYRQYRLGEISRQDYFIFNSGMIANLAHEENPRPYPILIPAIKQYIEQRVHGRSEMDSGLSQRMGTWIIAAYRALDHNRYLIDHFNWAKEKCSEVNLTRECELLSREIARFESLKFPSLDYLKAIDVQRMDSEARMRNSRDN